MHLNIYVKIFNIIICIFLTSQITVLLLLTTTKTIKIRFSNKIKTLKKYINAASETNRNKISLR